MSFQDLPPDWPCHPLTDPDLVDDVLDLCVSNADRATGGLAVLTLRHDLTLAQPMFVKGPLPRLDRRVMLRTLLRACSRDGQHTAFVVGIAHEHSALSDDDRRLHQEVIEACGDQGLTLVSTHLVTGHAIQALPPLRQVA